MNSLPSLLPLGKKALSRLRGSFRKLSVRALHARGMHLSEMTDPSQVQALLDRLRPVSCGTELIRLGPEGDGGYLVPDDLEGIAACFSPGVGQVAGFEMECANRGMAVFLADGSIDEPLESHELFHFTKKYLGVTTNDHSMTLDDWVASSVPDSGEDLLLQIDIEGSEYEVFLAMSDNLIQRFRVIVVEFHGLDQLWNKSLFDVASRAFDKLLQTHRCVHNHPNAYGGAVRNGDIEIPLVTELTFLRRDRVSNPTFLDTFPHPLDRENSTKLAPFALPKCWYRVDA
jgi:Methyltransferase FkbM domain